jgi:hypothetical protein
MANSGRDRDSTGSRRIALTSVVGAVIVKNKRLFGSTGFSHKLRHVVLYEEK